MTRGGYLLLVWSVSSKLWWCTLVIEMQECKLAYLQHACYVFAVDIKQKKKTLFSANHRPGYWSNLPCDWSSTAWAYSEPETENGPRSEQSRAQGSLHQQDNGNCGFHSICDCSASWNRGFTACLGPVSLILYEILIQTQWNFILLFFFFLILSCQISAHYKTAVLSWIKDCLVKRYLHMLMLWC